MKKVLFMAKAFGGGGAEVAMLELINKMPEEEYDITLALLDDDLEYFERLNRKVKIVQICFKNSFASKMVSMYSIPAKILKKLAINKIVPYYDFLFDSVENTFDEVYDLALDFYGYGYFLTGFMAEKIKAKRKATWLHDEDLQWWFKSVEKYAYKYNKIFAVSEAVKTSFCRLYPKLKDKVEVFYNVIDTDLIIKKACLPCKDKLDGKFKILTVGRLHNQKGYDVAIESAKILKERGIEFKWYAIGEGKEKEKLRKLIYKYGIEKSFILMGRKDNPYTYMKQCDLYVQPSRHEGYVITLVEARALCLPIITSDIPSAREQIQDGINGYIVSLDAEKFADKIQQVYNDRKLLNSTVEYLREHKPNFDEELRKLDLR